MKPHKNRKLNREKHGIAILVRRSEEEICLIHYKRNRLFPQKIRSIPRTTENRSNDMKWLIEGGKLIYDI